MSGFTIIVILILVMFASLAIFVLQADESELTARSPHEEPRLVPDGDVDSLFPGLEDEIWPVDKQHDETIEKTEPESLGVREGDNR
jgi:hypothetical protein